MGLESYLFDVIFRDRIKNEEIAALLNNSGAESLEDFESIYSETSQYKSLFFEIRSEKGLTQMHVLLDKDKDFVENFSVRFSVASPATVIDQTFEFFERLHSQTPIVLRDTEVINHLWRQDVKAGRRDNSFEAMRTKHEDDEKHEKAALIPIDAESFKANELGIAKRKIVLENEIGAIVGGGGETFRYFDNTPNDVEGKMVKIIEDEL